MAESQVVCACHAGREVGPAAQLDFVVEYAETVLAVVDEIVLGLGLAVAGRVAEQSSVGSASLSAAALEHHVAVSDGFCAPNGVSSATSVFVFSSLRIVETHKLWGLGQEFKVQPRTAHLNLVRPFVVVRIENHFLGPVSDSTIEVILSMMNFIDDSTDQFAMIEDLICPIVQVRWKTG